MKFTQTVIISIVIVIIAAACNPSTPSPSPAPLPTETRLPTATQTSTVTATPTLKLTFTPMPPTAAPAGPMIIQPQGTPLAVWKDIPIIPGAIGGDDSSNSYVFTILQDLDEVIVYYQRQMLKLGWDMWASGSSENGATMMFFSKGDQMVTLSVLPQEDGTTLVMILK